MYVLSHTPSVCFASSPGGDSGGDETHLEPRKTRVRALGRGAARGVQVEIVPIALCKEWDDNNAENRAGSVRRQP